MSTTSITQRPRRKLSLHVVERVSEATGVESTELAPLYETVDPDALDDLLGSTPGPVEVRFRYEGCRVAVRGDGQVAVTECEE